MSAYFPLQKDLQWQGQRPNTLSMESTPNLSDHTSGVRSFSESAPGTESNPSPSQPCTAAMCHQIADTEQSRAVCYFIGADSGPIKIGYASNPKARLQNLREASPYDLRILATASGGIYRERAYHIQFANRRMRGEWFERCPEILAEIEALAPSLSHRSLDGAVG